MSEITIQCPICGEDIETTEEFLEEAERIYCMNCGKASVLAKEF